jgi:hypothetical protein
MYSFEIIRTPEHIARKTEGMLCDMILSGLDTGLWRREDHVINAKLQMAEYTDTVSKFHQFEQVRTGSNPFCPVHFIVN